MCNVYTYPVKCYYMTTSKRFKKANKTCTKYMWTDKRTDRQV